MWRVQCEMADSYLYIAEKALILVIVFFSDRATSPNGYRTHSVYYKRVDEYVESEDPHVMRLLLNSLCALIIF